MCRLLFKRRKSSLHPHSRTEPKRGGYETCPFSGVLRRILSDCLRPHARTACRARSRSKTPRATAANPIGRTMRCRNRQTHAAAVFRHAGQRSRTPRRAPAISRKNQQPHVPILLQNGMAKPSGATGIALYAKLLPLARTVLLPVVSPIWTGKSSLHPHSIDHL